MKLRLLIGMLTLSLASGCAQGYTSVDKIDADGDGSVDVVRYFMGNNLVKEERLDLKVKNELNPRVIYFKNGSEVTVDGERYVEQEVDNRKTYGKNARWVLGDLYFYTKNGKVVFTKIAYKNGTVETIVLKNQLGATERVFENSNRDSFFDMFTLYDRQRAPRMAKISLSTNTPISELRKYMPPPDAPGPEIKDPATGKWFIRYDFRDQNKLVPVPTDSKYMDEIVKPFVIRKGQTGKKEGNE